jgi:hypothetical protein
MMDRRTFSTALIASVATSLFGRSSKAQAQPAVSARNVVLVHGAYAAKDVRRSRALETLGPAT